MAKKLNNIYPGLRAKMSYYDEDAVAISKLLKISPDSARRRLSGRNDFELMEVFKLIEHYNSSFDELFKVVER